MNPLPFDNQQWPFVRIVTAPSFGLTKVGSDVGGYGPWTVQPMWSDKKSGFGFELLTCSRVALPAIGEATFQYRFGFINDMQVGVKTAANAARRIAGSSWDPTLDKTTAPDLAGYEVRIQFAPPVAQGVTPAWRTRWWGQVEYQEDGMWPGAPYPVGVRTYRCLDGFARAKRWPLNRHSTYNGASWFIDVEGHPGYNVGVDGRIIGNRDAAVLTDANASDRAHNAALVEIASVEGASTPYKLHAQQGVQSVLTWTVQQAIEDAVRKTRGYREPLFSFNGTTDLLGDVIAMPVRDGDDAWGFTTRLCRRERGRGVVYVDWADDVATPTGLFSPRLTIRPQTLGTIDYTAPGGGSPGSIPGATSAGTTKEVDVIGDHRLVAEDTQLSDKFLHVADAVETTSELIQVLVTLSYYDTEDVSISRRWTAGREATYAALSPSKRTDDAWEPMWQLHGIPNAWNGQAKDHNGGTAYYCDFACSDAGALITSGTEGRRITSPILCRILPDLPLYEGYDHQNNPPVRKIGSQVSLDESGQPARKKPMVFIRVGDDRYLNGDTLAGNRSVNVHIRNRDVLITENGELGNKYRIIGSKTSSPSIGSAYNLSQLGITVAIELPHRVRRRTVRTGVLNPKRTTTIRLPDLHLWLAHSSAIWGLSETIGTRSTGFESLQFAAGGLADVPGKLRDDRDALSRLHAMACKWYLEPRQTGKWTLRACGLLPSFETLGDDPGSATETVTYPVIGELVTDFLASGQAAVLNTPITAVHYDHQSGRTTWETDWQELDFT